MNCNIAKILKVKFLIHKASVFVTDQHNDSSNATVPFHTLKNTIRVVRAVRKISAQHELTRLDNLVVFGAAWFLNTGFLKSLERPEKETLLIAQDFFLSYGLPKEILSQILRALSVGHESHTAKSLAEMILHDANTAWYASRNFFKLDEQLRQEHEMIRDEAIPKSDWQLKTIARLQKHEFYTAYAKNKFSKQKTRNINKLLRKTNQLAS